MISPAPNLTAEATSASGAAVTYTAPTATDAVDGDRPVTCLPLSGSAFALGDTTVSCTATDTRGNNSSQSFKVTVQDTTVPVLTVPASVTAEATGPSGAVVSYTASASDAVGAITTYLPPSGSTFALGTTTVECSADDPTGNTAKASFPVTVRDTTAPTITVPADITVDPTSASGAPVTYSVWGSDSVSGPVTSSCSPPSGSTFPIGTTTVTCSARDAAGNLGTGTFKVTVRPLTLKGFYQPVAMGGVYNVVKAGSTVPLKFEVFAASTELTATSVVKGFTTTPVACSSSVPTGTVVGLTTAGGTSLRYDTTTGGFIQNWKTPKTTGCYRATVTTVDGTTLSALFRLT